MYKKQKDFATDGIHVEFLTFSLQVLFLLNLPGTNNSSLDPTLQKKLYSNIVERRLITGDLLGYKTQLIVLRFASIKIKYLLMSLLSNAKLDFGNNLHVMFAPNTSNIWFKYFLSHCAYTIFHFKLYYTVLVS